MNYARRKNDNLIHTLMDDMKKMNVVITRLQREVTDLRVEVQELRQSVSHPHHGPGEEGTFRPTSNHPDSESGRSRGPGKFEKQREQLRREHVGESKAPTSNPWDDRRSTRCHHTVNHF